MFARRVFGLIALLLLTTAGVARAEAELSAPVFDPNKPDTWRLEARLPSGSPQRESLIKGLMARATSKHEAALTREEAEALLADPRAQLVYGARTVSLIAPSSIKKQRQQHVDLLQMYLKGNHLRRSADFAIEYAADLERAEKKHGVDREVIVAILMFETRLGTITGDFHAFNSFTSQAFFIDDANRVALSAAGEKSQLSAETQAKRVERIRSRAHANLLVLARMSKARNMDALAIKGSWAGALGFPQFMPASLRWAEDGDGDGKVDLFTFPDSIASIARYLSEHGFAKDKSKAVWGYNHEAAYVSGVLGFADAIAKELKTPVLDAVYEPETKTQPTRPAGSDAGKPTP